MREDRRYPAAGALVDHGDTLLPGQCASIQLAGVFAAMSSLLGSFHEAVEDAYVLGLEVGGGPKVTEGHWNGKAPVTGPNTLCPAEEPLQTCLPD